jgi:phosphohistidine phosphatase SixA
MLYLVRHAKAKSRSNWDGDDTVRPLTANGRAQADALADRLAEHAVGTLTSSPYLRCMQTLQPLAARLGTEVVAEPRLGEGADLSGILGLIETLTEGSVMCSHGDLIPATMAALERRGCRIEGDPDWRKGSAWLIQRIDGVIERAWAVAPPTT